MSRYASFRAVFITSYQILLYFCFIVKKEAIRKELKFYDHSLSIAVYDTIVISNKKRKRENLYIDIISNNPFDSPQMIQKRSYSKFLRWKIILEILESEIYDISPVCIYIHSISTLEAGTRQLVRSIALWAFTRLRLSRLTWPRNVTRTTIISISTPTNRCSQSRSTMGSPYFPSPHPTQEWICIYCR